MSENAGCARAAADDTWYYRLLKKAEMLLSDDVKRILYWQDKFKKPTVPGRTWHREVSGRLLSHACSIVSNAERTAQQSHVGTGREFEYLGIYHGAVSAIESSGAFQVWHEPLPEDPVRGSDADHAHAEVGLIDAKYVEANKITPDGIDEFTKALTVLLKGADDSTIAELV